MIKKLSIGVLLLIISWTAYSQESNKLILAQRNKLEILLDSYFYDFPSCQRSLVASDSLNSILKLSLAYSDSLNQIKATKIDLQSQQLHLWSLRYDNTLKLNEGRIKDLKRKKNKVTLIAIVEAVLILIMAF